MFVRGLREATKHFSWRKADEDPSLAGLRLTFKRQPSAQSLEPVKCFSSQIACCMLIVLIVVHQSGSGRPFWEKRAGGLGRERALDLSYFPRHRPLSPDHARFIFAWLVLFSIRDVPTI